ncbi:MAG: DUF6345 domain-containing protein [Longimicrobiaceae bacterium]
MRFRNEHRSRGVLAAAAGLAVLAAGGGCDIGRASAFQETLPVFELAAPDTAARLDALFRRFGITGPSVRRGDRLVKETETKVGETFIASGGVWLADTARLWKPSACPTALPDSAAAVALADAWVDTAALLPRLTRDTFRIVKRTAPTLAAWYDVRTRSRTDCAIHRQVSYEVEVKIPGTNNFLPMIGGGGRFTLVLGDSARTLAFSGVWRPVVRVASRERLISRAAVDRQFRSYTRGLRVASVERTLAYYSAPAAESERLLYPVWVYSGTFIVGTDTVEMRSITFPATRSSRAPPPLATAAMRAPSTPPPGGAVAGGDETEQPRFESGAEWVKLLPNAKLNAQGFLFSLDSAGWKTNFKKGGSAALLTDWIENDDAWVDAADFVFYAGHASEIGWQLYPGVKELLSFRVTGTLQDSQGDLWGQQDLEWLIIAACGPLQDPQVTPGASSALDRWAPAFDGLHLLMGYASRSYDSQAEGRTVVKYAREGLPLVDAWLRTAKELQGPRVYAAVMYAVGPSGSARNDHLWGVGSVSPDFRPPKNLVLIWNPS